MKNKSASSSKMAPTKSPRSMPSGPARKVRENQAKLNRSSSLGDDGPKTARFAPSKSPRPKAAGPARAVRQNQAKFDRSSSLGDSGPMNAATAFRVTKGYKSGGSVSCKTY